jgi:hypothetical protein
MLGIKTITLKSIFIEERKGGSNRRMVLGPVRDPDRGPVLIDQWHLAIKPPSCDKMEGKKTNKMVTVVRKECDSGHDEFLKCPMLESTEKFSEDDFQI